MDDEWRWMRDYHERYDPNTLAYVKLYYAVPSFVEGVTCGAENDFNVFWVVYRVRDGRLPSMTPQEQQALIDLVRVKYG